MSIRRNRRAFLPTHDALDRRDVPSVYTATSPAEYIVQPVRMPPSQLDILFPAPTPPPYDPMAITPIPPGFTPENPSGVPYDGIVYGPGFNPMELTELPPRPVRRPY